MVLTNFMAAINFAARHGVKVEHFELTSRVFVHIARYSLAERFLKSDAEWSLWLDSDMQIPKETIPELLKWAKALNAKLISGVYYQRWGDFLPVAMMNSVKNKKGEIIWKGKHKYETIALDIPDSVKEAIEVDFCGFGCVLIHREVFERMKLPYFKLLCCDDLKGLKEDDFIFEDTYFSVKARELGYKIYALPTLDLGHIAAPPVIRRQEYKKNIKRRIEDNPSLLDLSLVKNGGVAFRTRGLKK